MFGKDFVTNLFKYKNEPFFLIYTSSDRKDQICLLRKTEVYETLRCILQDGREEVLGCGK